MHPSSNVRIFVVDDHWMYIDGLVELLSSENDFEIVGQSHSVADAKRSLAFTNTDIVLLEVQLPDGDGFGLHEWIIDADGQHKPKVLYVTADDRLISINWAMTLGAMAYLGTTGGWEEVATAIRRATKGKKTLGTHIAEKLSEFSFMPDAD